MTVIVVVVYVAVADDELRWQMCPTAGSSVYW